MHKYLIVGIAEQDSGFRIFNESELKFKNFVKSDIEDLLMSGVESSWTEISEKYPEADIRIDYTNKIATVVFGERVYTISEIV